MRRFLRTLPLLLPAIVASAHGRTAEVSHNVTIVVTPPTRQVGFDPNSVVFGSQYTGKSSPAQPVLMINTGTASFPLSSLGITGADANDFLETNDCPSPLSVAASCQVNVVFKPTATGVRTASLAAIANGSGGIYTIALNGTGATAGTPLPPTFFGMHVATSSNWPSAHTIVAARGKCSGTTWPYLEPSKGTYNWGNLDFCLSVAQSHAATLVYSSDCTSTSLCSGGAEPAGLGIPNWTTCANLATDYGVFYTALVNRYGTKLIYELWNEPGSQGCSAAQFASAVNVAHDAIRSLAPGAVVLEPSFVGPPSYLSRQISAYYAAGGTQDVDGWTTHIYTDGDSPAVPESVLNDLSSYISAMTAAAPTLLSKPIWSTEGAAYSTANGMPDDATKAAYLARYYLLLWAKGIVRAYWYEWDAYGVISSYPVAVTAYDQVQDWLIGSSNPVLAVAGTVYMVTMTTQSGGSAQAVWNTAGSSSYAVPAGYGHYQDLAGNTKTVAGGSVTIGAQPLLLTP